MSLLISSTDLILGFSFGLLGLVIISWLVVVGRDVFENSKFFRNLLAIIFLPAPARQDVSKSSFPIRVVLGRIVPIILWILIIVPMVVFPIILILFPLLGIPWAAFPLPPP